MKEIECPVCKCHFPGKVMVYNEEGLLVERNCGRCNGTGIIQDMVFNKKIFANAIHLGSYCQKCEEADGTHILVKDCPHKEDLTTNVKL